MKKSDVMISEFIQRHPDIISAFFDQSESALVVITDTSLTIKACNKTLARRLYTHETPTGRRIGDILCPIESDAPLHLVFSTPETLLPQVLRICYTEILYRCYVFDFGDGVLLIGDPIGNADSDVLEGMSLLNNELTALSRELSRKNQALEIANQKITKLARTDELTGLINRRYFKERYGEAFSLAKRNNLPLSLVMMDLDHFKHVNDTWGHDAGDKVLKTFAAILTDQCRQGELQARFGGEEFIVLLPHTTLKGAVTFAERVRKGIKNLDILENGEKITVSGGAAEMGPDDIGETLIKRADNALYQAKNQGRNRIVALDYNG